ncbi:MAG: PIN domain-containing protein [Acidobacteria bacterium]|nr:PIN domain-containing protein [Acidobacteriota bacterium]MYJ03974.1 PIN domain-containing protein [Acidobacteriota bacterium]
MPAYGRDDLRCPGGSAAADDRNGAGASRGLPVKYLLDVNVLVAWGWSDHVAHEQTAKWIAATAKHRDSRLFTSPIPELGFVRVSVQRTAGRVTVRAAAGALAGMLHSLGAHHAFLPDDQSADRFPEWCFQASRTTDAHLLELAEAHGARLATLDERIPGAFLVPGLPE